MPCYQSQRQTMKGNLFGKVKNFYLAWKKGRAWFTQWYPPFKKLPPPILQETYNIIVGLLIAWRLGGVVLLIAWRLGGVGCCPVDTLGLSPYLLGLVLLPMVAAYCYKVVSAKNSSPLVLGAAVLFQWLTVYYITGGRNLALLYALLAIRVPFAKNAR